MPTGFIPEQDKGYLVVNAQLPDGASLERSDEVIARMTALALKTEGVGHTISVPGYSILTGTNIPNVGGMFVILAPFEERAGHPELSANQVADRLRKQYREIEEAQAVLFGAPPIDGLGSTGGFKMQVQDRSGAGLEALQGAVANVVGKGNSQPGLVGLFSSFSANQPQLYVDVDRVKAKRQGVALNDVFETLQVYLGSAYVNDITLFNRNWQVNVQADAQLPPACRGRRQAPGPQRSRRDGAPGDDDHRPRRGRSGHRQSLQFQALRGNLRRHGTGRQLRPGHRTHGTDLPSRSCRQAWASSGRS